MFFDYVIKNNLGELLCDVSFEKYNTMGCGGIVKHIFYPYDIESLCDAYKFLNINNIKNIVLGNGSNVLLKSDYYDGVIIILDLIEKNINIENNQLIVSSNINTNELLKYMLKLNIGDLSYLSGIPGKIGGMVVMNAGTHNKEISDDIIYVKYINSLGKIIKLDKDELNASYRYSIFKDIKGIIIEVCFKIKYNCNMLEKIKLYNKERSLKHPIGKSLGSIFKNKENIKAYQIIDEIGYRGKNINDAYISDKHSNFIINKGKCSSKDVLDLINNIKKEVYNLKNIILEEEIIIIE